MPPTIVRLPPDLVAHLKACAVANCRSLSGEVRSRLEQSRAGESIDDHGVIVRRVPASGK